MTHRKFDPEDIAQAFHERYELMAPEHSYETRKESAVSWESVPANNKSLMVAVVRRLIDDGIITPGSAHILSEVRKQEESTA